MKKRTTPGRARNRPRKRFGQHFLAPVWARKVVDAIAPRPGDAFLEVGPGAGALTLPLAAEGVQVLAVEVDRDLALDLAGRVPPQVTVVTGDFLTTDVIGLLAGFGPQQPPGAAPLPRRMRLVGNLPYNLSSPILARIISLQERTRFFADAVLMLQREVADRLAARPGTKAYGALTVTVRRYTEVTRLLDLPPGAFFPAPKVRSSLVHLAFDHEAVPVPDEAEFNRLVKALFSARRKTLANALRQFHPAGRLVATRAGLDERRRPETLQVHEITRLAELFAVLRRAPVL